jgi:DNA-binding transcriptional LysR family regulator
MNLDWIEDMLVLLEERNFSKAADRRHISQPAFSRRIQSLERWIGVPLVDRTSKPIGFTIDESLLEMDFHGLRDQIFELRTKIRAATHDRKFIRVAAQQALTISVFPDLTRAIQNVVNNASFRLRSANRDECIAMFLRGTIDVLLCYEAGQHQSNIPSVFAKKSVLFREKVIPVVSTTNPNWRGTRTDIQQPLPLLSYPPESFLGKVVKDYGIRELRHEYDLEVICESAFSAGLKEMVLRDMGIAWLPQRLIQTELEVGRMTDLSSMLGSIELQVALYWADSSLSELSAEIVDAIGTIFGPSSSINFSNSKL